MPYWHAHLACLVGEVLGDAGTWKGDEADGKRFQHLVVATEGCRLLWRVQSGLKTIWGDATILGPAGGDALGTLGAAAMQQDHVGMFDMDLVQRGPDAVDIVTLPPHR
ncbi:hypothetical protein IP70_17810 [alpha proteobacterium AAP38]|nr:hypothetical protein IP70_17810 [alpha proteobacterium AAP38]